MDLQGWFDYSTVYEQAIEILSRRQRESVRLAEVGVWKGTSISRLAHLARTKMPNRKIEIFAVDDWKMRREESYCGGPNAGEIPFLRDLNQLGRSLYQVYDSNLREMGLRELITDCKDDSANAASMFNDRSLDFVFIDADHTCDGLCRDLKAWAPKADILAGHDANEEPVRRALNAVFGAEGWYEIEDGSSWTTSWELAHRVRTVRQPVCLAVPTTPYSGVFVPVINAILHTVESRRDIRVRIDGSSLLTFDFNNLLCLALNNPFEWFVMLHSDVAPTRPDWIDVLLDLAELHKADVLSVVLPIKNGQGLTSTAIDTDPWRPMRLTLKQFAGLPSLFDSEFCQQRFGGDLLINTGLMAVRNGDWLKKVCFDFKNKIIKGEDGLFSARVEPEDWGFSRYCNAEGKKVMVTQDERLHAIHCGHHGYTNWGNWGALAYDEINTPSMLPDTRAKVAQEA